MAGQVTTIKLCRGDSSPWGFRLQGGKDWMVPLSVSKVNPGSLADSGGLRVGDIILKIGGQNAENILHKDAQDVILRAGNNLDITVAKGGTTTWQPLVTPVGSVPKPRPVSMFESPQPVTKTSLAKPQTPPVGAGAGRSHNSTATPFATFGTSTIPLVNKQYNSPINLYSMQNIKETLEAHTEILAPGVKGINFMKPDAPVNTHSAVYQAILEEESGKSKSGIQSILPSAASTSTNHESSHDSLYLQSSTTPYQDALRQSSVSPTVQSCAFRRLQAALDGTGGGSPVPPVAPVTASPVPTHRGFPPHIGAKSQPQQQQQPITTRHVEAPITAPKPIGGADQLAPGTNVCVECGRLIVGVFCRIGEKNLHGECFKCSTCGNSLKNTGYYNINDKLYCEVHAHGAARALSGQPIVTPVVPAAAQQHPSPSTMPSRTFEPLSTTTSGPPTSHSLLPSNPTPFKPAPVASSTAAFVENASPIGYHPVTQQKPHVPLFMQQTSREQQSSIQQSSSSMSSYEAMQQSSLTSSTSKMMRSVAAEQQSTCTKIGPATLPKPTSTSCIQQIPSSQPSSLPPQLSTNAVPTPWSWPMTTSSLTLGHPAPPQTTIANTTSSSTLASSSSSAAATVTGTPKAPSTIVPVVPAPTAPSSGTSSYGPSFAGGASVPSTGGPSASSSIPASGRSTVAGSRQAPRRGRGQLKPFATPGTRVPICAMCQTSVRGPFIVALGKTWCPDHFNCANNQCKKSLLEIGFVEEQGQLYCENCFEAYLAPICAKCNIRIKGECLMALEKQWHPQCFTCTHCRAPFGNNCFYMEDGHPYCEKDWNEMFTTKCVACGFPIEAGDRWIEALNTNYHSQCFRCTVCHKNLEGQSFLAKGGRPFCKSHAR